MLTGELVGAAEVASASIKSIASQATGLSAAAPPVPPVDSPPKLSGLLGDDEPLVRFPVVDDAIKRLHDTQVFAGSDFRQTAERVKQGSFAITADLKTETVQDIRQLFTENVAGGLDPAKFANDVVDLLGEGTGLSEARIDIIFRNNVQRSFSDGAHRAVNKPLVTDFFPYRIYFATHDRPRVRVEHLALEKLGLNKTAIYRADDPVWMMFRPPWDFGCRCSWSPITVKQAARRGVKEAIDWLARATVMAVERGGRAASYLDLTKPAEPQFVNAPKFEPSPEYMREVPV